MKHIVSLGALTTVLIGMMLWTVHAETAPTCVEQCTRQHPNWQQYTCSEGLGPFIVGEGCYAVQNDCFQECRDSMGKSFSEWYAPGHQQQGNRWRQKNACSPTISKFPLEFLEGTIRIEPNWAGQCECRNGRLIVATCGHNKISCNQACDGGFSF